MTKKLMLGLLGAVLAIGLTVPAAAQSDRGRGQNSESAYSQDNGRYDQDARGDRRGQYNDFRSDGRWGKTLTFGTRYRATIVLTENTLRGRGGLKNVCTVSVRGPQSRLVPIRQIRRIARNNCSRRAQVWISA